jgi:hypothetical protein
VFAVAAQALEKVKTLVMVADPEYVAASIYESIGFSAGEKQYRLEKMLAAGVT